MIIESPVKDQVAARRRDQRIAKNTLLLYARTLVMVGISLYTVRVVLNALGVDDYGLFQVVSGVVALLGFLPSSMASATQRDFSHALGTHDQDKLNRTFGVSAMLYLGIGLAALFLLSTVGLWITINLIRIPPERTNSGVLVFLLTAATFTTTIIKSPLLAIIVAHEDMKIYAYTAISDTLLKLSVALLLMWLPGDKIVTYAILLLSASIIDTTLLASICTRKYPECRLRNVRWDRHLGGNMIVFTSWTLFGQLTTMSRTAAVTVLMNQYFPASIIAARAIATNIASQCNMFATNFNTSLYPPIIKAYAAGEKTETHRLVIKGTKTAFFLMWLPTLPLYLEINTTLSLWLSNPPHYAADFARLTLIEGVIFALSLPLSTAARAPGQVALYESTLGFLQLCILIISWLLLRAGLGPHAVFLTAIAVNIIMFFTRLVLVGRLTELPINAFIRQALIPIINVATVTTAIAVPISIFRPIGTIGLILSAALITTTTIIAIYWLGLTKSSRTEALFIAKRLLTAESKKP